MTKFECDRCKREFSPGKFFFEGTIVRHADILMPQRAGPSVMTQQNIQRQIHFCATCTEILEKEISGNKKSA